MALKFPSASRENGSSQWSPKTVEIETPQVLRNWLFSLLFFIPPISMRELKCLYEDI